MELPSKILAKAVEQFATLPGVGYKTALRLTLHLLHQSKDNMEQFYMAFKELNERIIFCNTCKNITDNTNAVCDICNNNTRDHSVICVVENIKDLLAIERTTQYNGVYHILGGVISPMDGIGPAQLNTESLFERIRNNNDIREVILALPTSMEGDTTNFYIFKKTKEFSVIISTLARGISVGNEIEYTDEVTLGRSIVHRQPYEQTVQIKV